MKNTNVTEIKDENLEKTKKIIIKLIEAHKIADESLNNKQSISMNDLYLISAPIREAIAEYLELNK
jgi:hypothetical protein